MRLLAVASAAAEIIKRSQADGKITASEWEGIMAGVLAPILAIFGVQLPPELRAAARGIANMQEAQTEAAVLTMVLGSEVYLGADGVGLVDDDDEVTRPG